MSPIRIFVGCAANNDDLESLAVLEHSLRSRTAAKVEIVWMRLSRDPLSPFYSDPDSRAGWRTANWSTPFSALRWSVPELCGFEGRAIYMDSDMIIRADIAQLWNTVIEPGRIVVAKGGSGLGRFCVSLWDCAAAAAILPRIVAMRPQIDIHKKISRLLKSRPDLIQPFTANWNCVDGEDYVSILDPDIKIIHYSAEANQPYLHYAVPRLVGAGRKHWFDGPMRDHWRAELITMFDAELAAALAAGYRLENYMRPEFGRLPLQSHAHYTGNEWTPPSHKGEKNSWLSAIGSLRRAVGGPA